MNDTEARNGGGGNLRGLQPKALLNIVCVAGACVGAFFGSYAFPVGTVMGAAGGIVAGISWTRTMLRPARAGLGRGQLVAAGARWGIVVGLLATAIMQGGVLIHGLIMQAMIQRQGSEFHFGIILIILVIAAICAVIGGAITGAICGCLVPLKD